MIKSAKFVICAFGLLVGAYLMVTGHPVSAEKWLTHFAIIFTIFVGANQVQKLIESKRK